MRRVAACYTLVALGWITIFGGFLTLAPQWVAVLGFTLMGSGIAGLLVAAVVSSRRTNE